MNLVNWNPLFELDNMFRRRGTPQQATEGAEFDWRPAADISETETEYLIKADLPQVSKKDIEISVQNGIISIAGERRLSKEDETEKMHRIEKYYGRFMRSFKLPDDVDDSQIKARSEEGVLVVHLPKSQKKESDSTRIKIQ